MTCTASFKFYVQVVAILCCFKLLFIPAYRSTDFEVHRNWLAITHSLPISEWYRSNISIWTLDYPPLFAWMERGLSYPAKLIDEKMLDIENLDYTSQATVRFLKHYKEVDYGCSKKKPTSGMVAAKPSAAAATTAAAATAMTEKVMCLMLLFITNFGLFIVDHIHFQYNGILYGIMLLSLLKIYQDRIVESAFWFSVLLCMKHIYLYICPVFGVFMLGRCWVDGRGDDDDVCKFFLSSLRQTAFKPVIITPPQNSVGPMISRLFPFKRGLCHAYWAPNFWALYNAFDKFLFISANRIAGGENISQSNASMTGGLVQEYDHAILPSVKPAHTFILTAIFMIPSIILAWPERLMNKKMGGVKEVGGVEKVKEVGGVEVGGVKTAVRPIRFVRAVVLCAMASFMFGWHVHEKAILLVVLPLTLLALNSKREAGLFLLLSCVANFSLFPLIFTKAEQPLKYILCIISLIIAFSFLTSHHKEYSRSCWRLPLLASLESAYVIGLLFIETYSALLHFILFKNSLEFLPLMMTSCYCSLGVVYTFVKMIGLFCFNIGD
ncbi:hypothetical protein HELRODRAFT_193676 [Helobdella robusta]|uniref:Alpha-1,3-glucosyltransferase n=1 Tax=Helobdella robusta TaxID=6412 RepID=T1FV90_HELRO|nr:hypothetical protein HELRODRAFT_193676 [Helobdella robusta]ESN94966.1 hypothetical protein HELRODRAFT_193676 [Helobdella robusta]